MIACAVFWRDSDVTTYHYSRRSSNDRATVQLCKCDDVTTASVPLLAHKLQVTVTPWPTITQTLHLSVYISFVVVNGTFSRRYVFAAFKPFSRNIARSRSAMGPSRPESHLRACRVRPSRRP